MAKNGLKTGKPGRETTKIAKIAKKVGNLCSSVCIRGWVDRFCMERFEPGQHGGCPSGKRGFGSPHENRENREMVGQKTSRQPAASATLAAGWRGSAFVNACGEGKVPCLERGGKGKARAGAELRRGARL